VISVEDTGVGIEPAQLHLVFEMFAQLEPAIARKQTGLGIGLSLVRQLVNMHGGTIIANSEGKGRGSTFIVELPLVKKGSRKKAGGWKNV
jgi:signal transduction histidine kinase